MGMLKVIKTEKTYCSEDAQRTLSTAQEQRFECVLVVGIAPDGCVWAKKSTSMSRLQFLGAIELAKTVVMDGWEDAD